MYELDEHISDDDGIGNSLARDRLIAIVVGIGALAVAGLFVASIGVGRDSSGAAPVRTRAAATGVVVVAAGQSTRRYAQAEAAAPAARPIWTYPADGSLVSVDGIASRATRASGARSTVRIRRVSILDGRIVLRGVRMTATADVSGGVAHAAVTTTGRGSLEVDGVAQRLTPNRQIVIPGRATVSINEQATVSNAPRGDRQTGPRARVVGAIVHVRLMAAQAGLPAGSDIVIGRVDAGVRQGKIRAISHTAYRAPTPAVQSASDGAIRLQTGSPKPGTTSLPRKSVQVRASATAPQGPLQGYVFPVLGSSNFVDTWGAPRASTGIPHQGTDIFATEGTPIVAVADGVLDRVGWNSIGGYRFWLYDRYGNGFYSAHLSAFSPLARDGARVHAGDVIGFVGHTGDAQFTPPHLHFEIHPGNGAAVNPYRYLKAWRAGTAVPALVIGTGGRLSPLSLMSFSDISANSGLDGVVLDQVPDTRLRPVSDETRPKPTDETLGEAISGPAIAAD